jgi:hypothetical protein
MECNIVPSAPGQCTQASVATKAFTIVSLGLLNPNDIKRSTMV